MVAKSVAKMYTNIHKPTDYKQHEHNNTTIVYSRQNVG